MAFNYLVMFVLYTLPADWHPDEREIGLGFLAIGITSSYRYRTLFIPKDLVTKYGCMGIILLKSTISWGEVWQLVNSMQEHYTTIENSGYVLVT